MGGDAGSRSRKIEPFDQITLFDEIPFSGDVGAIAVYFEVPTALAGEIISHSGYLLDKVTHAELA
jgi:hypothetical protein